MHPITPRAGSPYRVGPLALAAQRRFAWGRLGAWLAVIALVASGAVYGAPCWRDSIEVRAAAHARARFNAIPLPRVDAWGMPEASSSDEWPRSQRESDRGAAPRPPALRISVARDRVGFDTTEQAATMTPALRRSVAWKLGGSLWSPPGRDLPDAVRIDRLPIPAWQLDAQHHALTDALQTSIESWFASGASTLTSERVEVWADGAASAELLLLLDRVLATQVTGGFELLVRHTDGSLRRFRLGGSRIHPSFGCAQVHVHIAPDGVRVAASGGFLPRGCDGFPTDDPTIEAPPGRRGVERLTACLRAIDRSRAWLYDVGRFPSPVSALADESNSFVALVVSPGVTVDDVAWALVALRQSGVHATIALAAEGPGLCVPHVWEVCSDCE